VWLRASGSDASEQQGFLRRRFRAEGTPAMRKISHAAIRILKRKPDRIRRETDDKVTFKDWMCAGAPSPR
jgi:hypothetical protein